MWSSRLFPRRLLDSIGSTCFGKLRSCRLLRMSTETPVEAIAVKEEVKDDENPLKRISESICTQTEPPTKKPKLKKKKVAMLISYCGQGYHGMQINHGFKTIEGELFDAFLKLGIMDEEAYKTPNLVLFQRAARTDKGVSAIKQVVSLKMALNEDDMVKKICENLPNCIRVFAIKKTTTGFNSKVACDSRSYAYVMPTFALSSSETTISKEYRLPEEKLTELNEVLGLYKGTRNYHNFTSRRTPRDPSCQRYITDFHCSKPYLVNDMEFVKLTIKGQSFMLNQIRKMIGLAISMMRGLATKENFESAFSLERIDIPIAPSLNLLLEEPHYKSYNRRFGDDGIHEALDWSPYESEIQKFCEEHVYPVIYNGETTEEGGSMAKWLPALNLHTFGPRDECANNQSCDSDN